MWGYFAAFYGILERQSDRMCHVYLHCRSLDSYTGITMDIPLSSLAEVKDIEVGYCLALLEQNHNQNNLFCLMRVI